MLLHILAATVWTGGHIVLSLTVLPKALKQQSPEILLAFESAYEKLGVSALLIQVLTGIYLAYQMLPDVAAWFSVSHPVGRVVLLKLSLLLITLGFALHARFRVIPTLNQASLPLMAWHVIPVTLIAILFVVVGVAFRTGWFY